MTAIIYGLNLLKQCSWCATITEQGHNNASMVMKEDKTYIGVTMQDMAFTAAAMQLCRAVKELVAIKSLQEQIKFQHLTGRRMHVHAFNIQLNHDQSGGKSSRGTCPDGSSSSMDNCGGVSKHRRSTAMICKPMLRAMKYVKLCDARGDVFEIRWRQSAGLRACITHHKGQSESGVRSCQCLI